MSYLNLHSKVLFIHTPKTAGSSMESKPFIGGGGHQNIEYFKRMVFLSARGIKWNEIFKFGFVRNPFDRFASAVTAHYMKPRDQAFLLSTNKHYDINRDGFTQFIKNNIKAIESFKWVHIYPQYTFLTLPDKVLPFDWKSGQIEVDFVGRYENLKKDWEYICHKIGTTDCNLPHIRDNKISDYSFLYTKETRDIIYKLYQKDFELFDYKYET